MSDVFHKISNSQLSSEEKLRNLVSRSLDVFLDESSEKEHRNIAGFIFSWKIFGSKLIPFELWSDICEEGLVLLKKLLEDPSIPYTELPGFKEFEIRKREKLRAIQKMPEYAYRFTMDAFN